MIIDSIDYEKIVGLFNEIFNCTDSSLQINKLTGGMTNSVYICQSAMHKALLRIYGTGTEFILIREEEIKWAQFMSDHLIGPRILLKFDNGRFEEFYPGQSLTSNSIRNRDISIKIAKSMARLHELTPGESCCEMWGRIETWCIYVNRPDLLNEMYKLQSQMSSQRLVICHNDLQYGNLLDVEGEIRLIDFEYCCINHPEFDVANHFCEWMADYSGNIAVVNPDKFPTKEERKAFISAYLNTTERRIIEEFDQSLHLFVRLSHLHWGIWGLCMSMNQSNGFDYKSYAERRLHFYSI